MAGILDFQDASVKQAQRRGETLAVVSALLWIPQAYVIAWGLAALLEERPIAPLLLAACFLSLGFLRAALTALSDTALTSAADTMTQKLRQELLAREVETLEVSKSGGSGALAAFLTDKIEALRPMLQRYAPAARKVRVLPFVILAIALAFGWAVPVILIVAGPLIPVFMALVGWAAKEASLRQMDEIGSFNDLLADRLSALSDLRLIGAGSHVLAGFGRASDRLRTKTMAVLRIAFLSSAVLEFFSALGVAMVAVWVGFSLLDLLSWGTWGTPLTPFAGLFLLLLAPDFFQPLRELAAAWHDKAGSDAVLEELATWRNDPRGTLLGDGRPAAPMPFEILTTQDLTFRRNGGAHRFPDISLARGKSLAVTGASGTGKTTLLRLVAGLLTPTEGQIRNGAQSIGATNADAWRASLGWMPQTPHFLSRSLDVNVGFGAAISDEIWQTAHLKPVLARLPKAGATRLGDRGAGLSGGEARRVMLARALQRNPALLIVDEPTADLDTKTAADVIGALRDFVRHGGTLLAATHDPVLARALDAQIRLEPSR